MPSMFDIIPPEDQADLKRQGMLSFASGLLNASGWSPRPVSMGQALGQGLQNYQQTRAQTVPSMLQGAMLQRQIAGEDEQKRNRAELTAAMDPGQWTKSGDAYYRPGVDMDRLERAARSMFPEKYAASMLEQPKPKDPIKVGKEEVLLDPNNGFREVARGPQGKQDAPADIDAYNFARTQGYAGSFMDFLQERVYAREKGQQQAAAAVTLGSAADKAREAKRLVQMAIDHPGRTAGTGATAVLPSIPGTNKKDFDVLMKQIRGQAFLEAFQSLKGAGAITEREGGAATDAMARLDQAQSEEAFLKALNELNGIIDGGLARLEERARGASPNSAPLTNSPTPAQPAAQGGWSIKRIE